MPIVSSPAATAPRLGKLPFAIAVLSFVPIVGIVFGAIAVFWGVGTDKKGGKTAAALGATGIVVANFVLFWLFFVFIDNQRDAMSRLVVAYAQASIDTLIDPIEKFKAQHGKYPPSLQALHRSQPAGVIVTIVDPTYLSRGRRLELFYYRRLGDDRYDLRSVGVDGRPFTSDDIIPRVPASPAAGPGLVRNP